MQTPHSSPSEMTVQTSPLSTVTEARVAAIWAELLQVDQIRPEDDFFERGGDSMLMSIAQFRISDELGVELPPSAISEAPTLRGLCARIDELSAVQRHASEESGAI